jgi:hypothetical protein
MSEGKAARPPFYKRWYAIVLGAAALVGAVSTLTGTARSVVDFGLDRFDGESAKPASAAVDKLRSGVQISEFQKALGSPRIKRQRDQLVEYIFQRPEFYVQALARGDEVVVFSLTGRTKSFTAELPQFRGCAVLSGFPQKPAPPIRLDRTRFSNLAGTPDAIFLYAGASGFAYSEVFGGPHACNFQFYVLSYNPAVAGLGDVGDAHRSVSDAEHSLVSSGAAHASDSLLGVSLDTSLIWDGHAADLRANPSLVSARRHLAFNTYTETEPNAGEVLAPFLSLDSGLTFGPSESDLAVLS